MTSAGDPGPRAAAVIAAMEAYNDGDTGRFGAIAHADAEWEVAPEHPASTTHRGLDAIAAYHEDWRATLDDLHLDVRSVTEYGDRVLAVCRISGKGGGSGADVEVDIAFLCTFRDDKVARVEEFLNIDEAQGAFESELTSP